MGNIRQSTVERLTGESERFVNARSKAMEKDLERWLIRFAQSEARKMIKENIDNFRKIQKPGSVIEPPRRSDDQVLYEDLKTILLKHGVRTLADSANENAGQEIISQDMIADVAERRLPKIQWFYSWANGKDERSRNIITQTKNEVREVIGDLIHYGMREQPRPAMSEMARRIRNTLYSGPEKDKVHHFGPSRAALIARTEIGIDEAVGEAEGYLATSKDNDRIRWIARSGSNHRHGRLNGVSISVSDIRGSPDNWFKGPLKRPMRYPKDPLGDIGDIANCLCAKAKVSARL